nr:unknown [Phytophthora infestans RNA virus 1]
MLKFANVAPVKILLITTLFVLITLGCDLEAVLTICAVVMMLFTMLAPARNEFLNSLSVTIATVILFVSIAFFVDNQIVVIGFGFLLCGGLVFELFKYARSTRAADSTFVLFFVCLAIYLIDYVKIINETKGVSNALLDCLHGVGAIMVPYGRTKSVLLNDLILGVDLYRWILRFHEFPKIIAVGFGFVAFGFFLAIRAVVAWNSVPNLRTKYDLGNVMTGLYVYCIDVFQWTWLFYYIIGSESWNYKRGFYSLFNAILIVAEFNYALDFLVVRFMLWVGEKVFFQTGYLKMTRLLNAGCEIELDRKIFPVKGAFPWLDVSNLLNIVDNVKGITSFANGVTRAGQCLVRRDERGMTNILTVDHVVGLSKDVSVGGVGVGLFETRSYKGVDPVIALNANVDGGTDVPILSKNETSSVKHLIVIHSDKRLCFIDRFKFGRVGEIEAVVNLRAGDSGGPIIGVLSNGEFRYVGAVSRGSFDDGSANFISSVLHEGGSYSPGSEGRFMDRFGNKMAEWEISSKVTELLGEHAADFELYERKEMSRDSFKRAKGKSRAALDALISVGGFSDKETSEIRGAFEEGQIVRFNMARKAAE